MILDILPDMFRERELLIELSYLCTIALNKSLVR